MDIIKTVKKYRKRATLEQQQKMIVRLHENIKRKERYKNRLRKLQKAEMRRLNQWLNKKKTTLKYMDIEIHKKQTKK